MSQQIHICPNETEIWSAGGNIYHTEAQARRYGRSNEYLKDEHGEYVRDEKNWLVQVPPKIYKVTLVWEDVT